MKKILTIKNLDINFRTRSEIIHAIRNISLDIYEGEILAIVGESGSGKSVLTKSFTNMLGDTGYIINGEIICRSDILKEPVDIVKIHREAIDRKYLKEFVLINKKRIKKNNKEIKKIINASVEDIQDEIASLSNEIKQWDEKYNQTKSYGYLMRKNETKTKLAKVNELLTIVKTNKEEAEIKKIHAQNDLINQETEKFTSLKHANKYVARKTLNTIRGKTIASIFQDPMTSLNPLLSVGFQISESLRKHCGLTRTAAKKEAINLLRKVGVNNPEKRYRDIPSKYSGGMRQRVVIAIALASKSKILIADEPTTALDVTVQKQILELLKSLQKEYGLTIVFITHDLGVVANIANRVAVMYAGQIVEYGKVDEIFFNPKHPYTWALLSSMPQLAKENEELYAIPGSPPSLSNAIVGDAFAPRNHYALAIDYIQEPPFYKVSDTHYAKTWLLDKKSPKVTPPKELSILKKMKLNSLNNGGR